MVDGNDANETPERPDVPADWSVEPSGEPGVVSRVSPDGVFRVRDLVERRPPGDARAAAVMFLRPDDSNFEDRALERTPDGRWIATARVRPSRASKDIVRYLWFVIRERGDGVDVAARSVELPRHLDGDPDAVKVSRAADAAMRRLFAR